MSSIRPVPANGLPERLEATAPPPVSGSCAAAVGQQPGRCPFSGCRSKIAKRVSRSPVCQVGEVMRDAVLFLYATSWSIMRRWVGIPLWDGGLMKHAARSGGGGSGQGAATSCRQRSS